MDEITAAAGDEAVDTSDPTATSSVDESVSSTDDVSSDATTTTATSTVDPADPGSETAEAEPDGEKPKGKTRAQERIEELATTNKYLREHNEWMREQLSTRLLKPTEGSPTAETATPEAVPKDRPPPTLESVGFDSSKLAIEQGKWMDEQVELKVNKALERTAVKAAARTQEQVIIEAAKDFRKDHPDFDLMLSNPALQFTRSITTALTEAGVNSPAIGYHLAKNPDKLAKIAAMSHEQTLLAIGNLQAQLAVSAKKATEVIPPAVPPKVPAKKPVTPPPAPLNPIAGAAASDFDPMLLSPTEWRKWRTAEKAKERQAAEAQRRSS